MASKDVELLSFLVCFDSKSATAALIYMASDPKLDKIPDFHSTNEHALVDMKRLADLESKQTKNDNN